LRAVKTTQTTPEIWATLPPLVRAAATGDSAALDAVLRAIQHDVYNLAVRMLWCPDDAADATQEILLKIVTRLATFEGRSSFRTWVFRVAANHLLDIRRSRVEREELSFDGFAESLRNGLAEPVAGWEDDPEQRVLVEEVKIGCTTGMLLCLDRAERIAYVLADVFEFTGDEGASMLGITPAAFRKRLSRARTRLRGFMRRECGLVNDAAPCRCAKRVQPAVAAGRMQPTQLAFARHAAAGGVDAIRAAMAEMETFHRIGAIYRSHPWYAAPDRVVGSIKALLESKSWRIFD
jgi:RNA polymerase sigma factor (sigma-70 family)